MGDRPSSCIDTQSVTPHGIPMVTALPAEEVQQRIQSTANIIGETEADIVEALGYFVGEDFTDILEAMEIIRS